MLAAQVGEVSLIVDIINNNENKTMLMEEDIVRIKPFKIPFCLLAELLHPSSPLFSVIIGPYIMHVWLEIWKWRAFSLHQAMIWSRIMYGSQVGSLPVCILTVPFPFIWLQLGYSILMMACTSGCIALVTFLLSREGSNVNRRTKRRDVSLDIGVACKYLLSCDI